MTINDFYALAEKEGIEILDDDLPENGSVSVLLGGDCFVGLDRHLSGPDLYEHLAHELGHCCRRAFYGIGCALSSREKQENKAWEWAIKKALPLGKIKKAFRLGDREAWQIADRYDVSQTLVERAVSYYRSCGAICS